jgi:hypothetical protein
VKGDHPRTKYTASTDRARRGGPLKRLARDAFERACAFLSEQARPLEAALFRSHFRGGSCDEVVDALAAYQNDDGGFGHGIEPDFELPDSSAMATSVAFIALREAGVGPERGLVGRAVEYLAATWDPDRPGWLDVPTTVNDHPHAPWWTRIPEQASAAPAGLWGNPNAELCGVLLEHRGLVEPQLRADAAEIAIGRLEATPSPVGPYVALSYLRFAAAAPADTASRVVERLRGDAASILDFRPENLAVEHFHPHWLAPAPDAPLADALRPHVAWDLEREIDRQDADGSWAPRWSWGNAYPEAWERAAKHWRGELTLRNLRALAAWGLIEGL